MLSMNMSLQDIYSSDSQEHEAATSPHLIYTHTYFTSLEVKSQANKQTKTTKMTKCCQTFKFERTDMVGLRITRLLFTHITSTHYTVVT